jgi:Zn-dependent M28 family amino/carboxypeptidase
MAVFLSIRRLLEKGPVAIGFSYENQISGSVSSSSVIAELRGSEKPEEWMVVGGHLDSWDLATGAQVCINDCTLSILVAFLRCP